MKKNYYLGLDIGTTSVGWAVTDSNYQIPKFKGNAMWGIRLFDESDTAAERRSFRSGRRRTQRRRERLNLLEMLFDGEISKIDPSFFMRLKESNLYTEDKTVQDKNAVFADSDYTDKDFYEQYPTIYHLRKELIDNQDQHDPRLVFLALHHLIKNRGHFLFDSLDTAEINDFEPIYNVLISYLSDNYEISLDCQDVTALSNILKDRQLSKTEKNKQVFSLFGVTKKNDKQACACLSLLCGSSVKLCDLYNDDTLKDIENKNISFADNFDDGAEYQSILSERYELIEKLKAVYDWALLADILNSEKYISYAKVAIYNQHKQDLKTLKQYVKTYFPKEYSEIFRISKEGLSNYTAYSGYIKENSRTGVLNHKCSQQEFCAYLKKKLGSNADEKYGEMFARIEAGTFMPKQVNKDNGVIPMQVHRAELVAILNNAKNYLDFLSQVDPEGLSVYDKIIALFDYRIPYYVGPLNTHSKNSWIVRSKEKIYPWNFEKVVDLDKSAEAFIENLTSKCTYLPDNDVIPKKSILYSKFMVLNELNNLKIDGKDIDVSLKQSIYNDLFLNYNKVTNKKLKNYLHTKGVEFAVLSGIDGDFKSSLKSLCDFQEFESLSLEDKEQIIYYITIFGDDKKLLKKRLRAEFSSKLTEEELCKIFKLKYTGWSNLSRKFLTGIESVNKETGEIVNIISAMWQTNNNLMQVLYSDNFEFEEKIKELNSFDRDKSMRQLVEDLYVSPKVKRSIYQSLLIAKEIDKIQKQPPKKIFVEVAKGEGTKERKLSRKATMLNLYKSCKKDNDVLYQQLLDTDDDKLKQDKLYLYYTQLGKCMYTGEPIDLSLLMENNSIYDIDHIFPRSKIKDDSLDNRVLVKKVVNADKTDVYPLSKEIREKMESFWKLLLDKELISRKKFERLIRNESLTDDELSAFISRQLVETRQSTKAVAHILEQLYPNTEIVYVKAALVSDFRHCYDMLKSRDINDLHHAKDAYLNIVVGNVYNVKFTHNKRNFIKGLQTNGPSGISLNQIYNYNTDGAWVAENDESLNMVKKTMNKNNILYTRYSFEKKGGFFKQTIKKKGCGLLPTKAHGAFSDLEKYGGYNEISAAYFCCVEHGASNKRIRSLFAVDLCEKGRYEAEKSQYLIEKFNLVDPLIIVEKIKVQSCFSFNGCLMHLGGKGSGGSIIKYRPAAQLVLGYDNEKYFKNICKYLENSKGREINKWDNLTKEDNINFFETLLSKFNNRPYSFMFSGLTEQLNNAAETFNGLATEQQCYVLKQLVIILHCNAARGDLKLLGIKNQGIICLNNNISKIKNIESVKLINQSVTGLFKQEVELLK